MSGNKLFDGLRIAPHTHPLRLARRSCAHCAAHRHSLTACLTHRSQQSTINLPIPSAADSNQQPSLTHSLTHRQSLKLTQNSNSNSNSKLAVAIFAFRCPNLELGIWFIHSSRSLTHSLTVKSINRRFDAATRRLSFAVSLSQHARSSLVFLCTVLLHFFPHLKHTHRHRTHPRDRISKRTPYMQVYCTSIWILSGSGKIQETFVLAQNKTNPTPCLLEVPQQMRVIRESG